VNEYAKLIKRVKAVNRIAALRLAREIPLLAKRGVLASELHFGNGMGKGWSIASSFTWFLTRQGRDYWKGVSDEMGER